MRYESSEEELAGKTADPLSNSGAARILSSAVSEVDQHNQHRTQRQTVSNPQNFRRTQESAMNGDRIQRGARGCAGDAKTPCLRLRSILMCQLPPEMIASSVACTESLERWKAR
ncbi:hypothetical protein B0H12DRAFT_1100793 [Mycena haematopus]|nr:hypothetical protein B0H12DRAFT_1100793 [Mycena haematopus]